jgi:hypothetical protein
MRELSRREFVGATAGALTALSFPANVLAATCTSGFLPGRVSVDCASQRNFQLFRGYSDYVGLTGVVTMNRVAGKYGTYDAGSLCLFPWLKPKGQGKSVQAFRPTGTNLLSPASAISGTTFPLDEYLCRIVLVAPWKQFIGFSVDTPFDKDTASLAWSTNVDKLADGQGVGIDWTSANLNDPWFAGSRWIPDSDQCQGNAWRKVIIDGLNQAAAAAC